MDVIEDISSNKKEIFDCIKKYGFVREHNYWFFSNQENEYCKVYFFKSGSYGLFALKYKSGLWEVIGEALAPENQRINVFGDFLDHVSSEEKNNKIFSFVPENFYDSIRNLVGSLGNYKINGKAAIYSTPIFNLNRWDENLEGSEWKKLRNIKNQFFKLHKVEIFPCREVGKEKLIEVIGRWRKK